MILELQHHNDQGNITGNHTVGGIITYDKWFCWILIGACHCKTGTACLASNLTGTPDITVRNITGVAATFTGVLTYEDVTNVDSVISSQQEVVLS